jgi:hypothetical protein
MPWTKITSSGVTDVPGPTIPGQNSLHLLPVLQREDGSFAGTAYSGTFQWTTHMVVFSAGGNALWSVPNESPLMALAGSRIVSESGGFYLPGAASSAQLALPRYSWKNRHQPDFRKRRNLGHDYRYRIRGHPRRRDRHARQPEWPGHQLE